MNIGIVGLGLIGGSLGMDLRAQGHRVLGMSRRDETCHRAIDRGMVDDASPYFSLMGAADIIFICTPLGEIIPTITHLIPHLAPETTLTDVGSVKAPIVSAAASLWSNFVGGHPMAGNAGQGLDAAEANLFAGNPYVLTPSDHTPDAAIRRVEELVRSLQAKVYFCRPEDHDRAVAWISHLPVMVSASLIAACAGEVSPTVHELAQALASSGFRDTSRVGGGNPELGVMMARYNRDALLDALRSYRGTLEQLTQWIEQENWVALEAHLQETQQNRPAFVQQA